MKPIRYLISGNKMILHVLFILAVLGLLLLGLYFLHVSGFRFETWAALTNCLFFILCIYTGRWLCQTFYLQSRFAMFIICSIMAFILLAVMEYLLVKYLFHHPYAGFMELVRGDMPFFLAGVLVGMLLKLISASMQKELQDAKIKAEQREAELNLLQSQLSPHFLFNVLNNLYGISIEDHQRIPQLLLKLSNLLRYSVYGSKKPFVPLKNEVEYIKNYVEFEQIRISDRLNLIVDMEPVHNPAIQIAPQVLIVFIENAFKHSKNTLSQEIEITIRLKIIDNFINLQIVNSYGQEKGSDVIVNENSGLGLANTTKRLDLLYGKDYQLMQYTDNRLYHTELKLMIRE